MTTREMKARLRKFGWINLRSSHDGGPMGRREMELLLLEEYWWDGYKTATGERPPGGLAK